jgi:hypothetical protein
MVPGKTLRQQCPALECIVTDLIEGNQIANRWIQPGSSDLLILPVLSYQLIVSTHGSRKIVLCNWPIGVW